MLTTVTAVVAVVCDSTDTTDTSVWVTVLVVSLAEAVTVTSSVVVFVSAVADAVTVWTTVVAASVVIEEEEEEAVVIVVVVGDPPSMGTTEYGSRGRKAWNLPTGGSSARGRHIEGPLNARSNARSGAGRLCKRIFFLLYFF